MSDKGAVRKYLRAAFVENFWLKLISFGFAFALYALSHGPQDAQKTISVGVVALMPPDSANRQLLTQLPTEVSITLRGSRAQLDDLRLEEVGSLRLDLRSGRDQRVDLESGMFNVPPGIIVEQIIPASISPRWDDVVERAVPVQVPRTGEPAPGFALKGPITAEPPEVRARGPRSIVDVLQFARAAPYDVGGLTEGVHTQKLPLDKPPSLAVYHVDQITASVEIAREQARKTFAKLRIEVIGLPRATSRPATVTVIITGTGEDVNTLSADSIVPRVDPKHEGFDITKPGKENLPVIVDLPRLKVEVDPPKVVVSW